jgi:tripartite ATP-independent transporter DctM subunit
MDPTTLTVLVLFLLLMLLLIGLPLAAAAALAGFTGIIMLGEPSAALNILGLYPFSWCWSVGLAVIPLFIFMGQLAAAYGFAKDAYDVATILLRKVTAGLAIATTVACGFFAAVSGSSLAAVAMMGEIAVPEMRQRGYDSQLAAGVVAASGTLAMLIPPSALICIYGILTEQSIGKLLIAGIIPGAVSVLIYGSMIYLRVKINPRLAPSPRTVITNGGGVKDFFKLAFPIVLIFIIVIGGIYTGIFTATEAAGVGAFVVGVFGAVRRRGEAWQLFLKAFKDTAHMCGMIFAVVIGISILTGFFAMAGLPFWLENFFKGLNLPPILILIIVMSIYIPIGMFMDAIGIVFLTVPLVWPIMESLGIDGIWFGILLVKSIELGEITPPIGLNVYVLKGAIPDMSIGQIFKSCSWFAVMDVLTISILVAFPKIVLFLPSMMR